MDQNLDNFYLSLEEPLQSYFLAMRKLILDADKNITNELKYGMPFFSFKGKMFCYLWFDKKLNQPYIGFVEGKILDHPELLQEKRKRMKILMLDTNKDIPIKKIKTILKELIDFYNTNLSKPKTPSK